MALLRGGASLTHTCDPFRPPATLAVLPSTTLRFCRRRLAGRSPFVIAGKWDLPEDDCRGGHRFHTNALALSFPVVGLKDERTIPLPIDYYKVLGADTHFLADAIIRAYGARINNSPREGFSQEALLARQEILKGACETLADPDLRGDYNQGLVEDEAATLMIDVPWSKLSGALCLLQEVGEWGVVLQAGQDLLQEQLSKSLRRDIVLAMALSYVELSREAMAENPPALIWSSEMLETALKLLQESGGSSLAPALQEQIDETLRQINPRCILEILALPLTKDFEIQREEGLQGLRSILWAVGEGGVFAPISGFSRDQFMKEAYSHMTSSEQVAFFTATPNNIPAHSSEVYVAALAHVADGFVSKKPHLIQEAHLLFSQIQQSYGSSMLPRQQLDFAVERGLCALLLGELDDCYNMLGLNDETSSHRDPAVYEFVYSNSVTAEEGGYLPGLCRLLESWLAEVVFPSFRNNNGLQFKLGDYYDDPGVLSYLEKMEKGGSPQAAAAAIAQLRAGAGAALETLQKVFPLGKARPSLMFKNATLDVEAAATLQNAHSGSVVDFSSGDSTDLPVTSASDLENTLKSVGEEPMGESDSISTSSEFKIQRYAPLNVLTAGAAIGALAFVGWRVFAPQYQQMDSQKFLSTPAVIAPSQESAVSPVNEEVPRMDARLAEHMVRQWQSAKAQALGPNHMLEQIHEVLDGEMLRSWSERAKDVTKNGWHWEYELFDLSIDSVTISPDGRRALVEATLQEAAHLYGSSNPEQESYLSTYTTRYELKFVHGKWKIINGAVLRS